MAAPIDANLALTSAPYDLAFAGSPHPHRYGITPNTLVQTAWALARLSSHTGIRHTTHYPMALFILPGEEFTLQFPYRPSLFTAEQIQGIADRYTRILHTLTLTLTLTDPDQSAHTLDGLAPQEHQQVLTAWNDTARAIPTVSTFRSLTERGTGPEHLVALAVPRSPGKFVAPARRTEGGRGVSADRPRIPGRAHRVDAHRCRSGAAREHRLHRIEASPQHRNPPGTPASQSNGSPNSLLLPEELEEVGSTVSTNSALPRNGGRPATMVLSTVGTAPGGLPDHRQSIRVLLVGDHPLFRDGVRMALEGAHSLQVTAEAASGDQALAIVQDRTVRPDVVLVDLQMADGSGIDVTRSISEHTVGGLVARTVVISAAADDGSIVAALRAGARGYLLKGVAAEDLVSAVRMVADGGAVFSPLVAARLGAIFSAVHEIPVRAAFPELTNREGEILDLIARGMDNQLIANTLVLSRKTVRNHITSLFAKLRVTDRVAAAMRARDAGLG